MRFGTSREPEPGETPQRRLEDGAGVRETVIAAGSTVQGKLLGELGVRVAGTFEGEVQIAAPLVIEAPGVVQGTVRARAVIVAGELRGTIEAADKVELQSSGRVLGDITCHKLAMAEGCVFQGGITMPEEAGQPKPFGEQRPSPPRDGGPASSG